MSNVSFGIDPHARAVLNWVFLHHAVQAGLDLAIVNPAHITPYAEIAAEQRRLADNLINNEPERPAANTSPTLKRTSASTDDGSRPRTRPAGMTVEQKIHYQILHRKQGGHRGADRRGAHKAMTRCGVLKTCCCPP